MKRMLAAILAMVLLLSAAGLAAGEAVQAPGLPEAVQKYLDGQKLDGYTVAAYSDQLGAAPNRFALVLMQNAQGKHHILYVFGEDAAAGWKYRFRTGTAIPQGAGQMLLNVENANHFTVAQINENETAWNKYVEYELRYPNTWCLTRYVDYSRKMYVELEEDGIVYYGGPSLNQPKGRVAGTVQTDLRYVDLSYVPSTLVEAKRGYTLAPRIPAGTLTAHNIKFTGGRKYAVYSGPGENYLRSANDKAAVSTNDWIQVFGRENGWILIQYAISKDQMRFGWIDEKALPRSARVDDLDFVPMAVSTNAVSYVTDDPLNSQTMLLSLPQGTQISWLATMGDWAYIEYAGEYLVRGFIPVANLLVPEDIPEGNG